MTQICPLCGDPLAWGALPPREVGGLDGPAHDECVMRLAIGGVNHLRRICTCCGGTAPPDPEGMPKHAAALAAVLLWHRLKRITPWQ